MSAPASPPAADPREALRAALLARSSAWYSPWAHLIVPSLVGLAIMAGAAASVRGLEPLDLLAIPLTWVLSNAFEWRVHRDVLHRRQPLLAPLFDRHTPEHHRVFLTEDMAIRSTREFRLVLIPAFGVIGIVLLDLGITVAVAAVLPRNVAVLYLLTAVGYTLSYEWLHLCYHLPVDSFIGRWRLIRWLGRHHAIHHHPERMQRWNFNVTVPLWDWVRGTIYRGE